MIQRNYNVGIYTRLSQDDERAGESLSIENQKLLLKEFVQQQGWNIYNIYVDGSDKIGLNQQSPYSKGGALI